MNKLFIVILAVCLVTVHGFVKRDAPAAADDNKLADLQKNFQELTSKFTEDVRKNFDSEKIKGDFNKFVDDLRKTMDGFQTPNKS